MPDSSSGLPDPESERLAWRLAVDAAGVGAWAWDLATMELRWDERLLELFGLTRETFGGTIEAFNESVHPDDREQVTEALTAAIETCGVYEAEYRIVLPDGELRWIFARGRALPGPDGSAARVLGAAYDTTAAQDGEARVRRVMEAMPSAFFHLDPEWRFTFLNAEARTLLGAVGSDLAGQSMWELFPQALGNHIEDHYRRAAATGTPVTFETYYPAPLDRWYEVHAWPTPDGLSVHFADITDSRKAQAVLDSARARAELLAGVTAVLTETLDTDTAVAELARLVVDARLADWSVVSLVDGGGPEGSGGWKRGLYDVAGWHVDADLRPAVQRYTELRIPALRDQAFLARALAEARPVLIDRDATERIAQVFEPGEARDLYLSLAPESAVIVPVRGRSRTVGVLSLFRSAERQPFSAEDVDVLAEVAGRAGLALDNARLYAEQRDLAAGLQRTLLTAPPQPPGVQIAVRYEPAAEAAQVGGDWYDAFLQRDGATVLAIGDVMGHDTEAAAAMGQLRNLLRGVAVTTSEGPAGVLHLVDEAMQTLLIDTTASAVLARLEDGPEGGTLLRWSNAGHPPPLVGRGGQVTALWPDQPEALLGIHPSLPRSDHGLPLRAGDTVLFYTDGLVERRGRDLDTGVEQLRAAYAELLPEVADLDELCDGLLGRLVPDRPDDDVALVLVRLG
ncbi:SpoIIE family protein phosphatase [Nocardioides anomalus]|uniref:SpoIIE family protein phosphatase n=1 Tax=Nocardioides anomalus TaxID=2712223 RepID=UPI001E4F965B|nr:SpoIIE family protein phosphatase [Nocardioides anomalus]